MNPLKTFGRFAAVAVVPVLALTVAALPASASDPTPTPPTVSRLSVRSGGTWGGDLVTITGTGFDGAGTRQVTNVLFGGRQAAGSWVVNATTVQAFSPQVSNKRKRVDVRVVLHDGTKSARSSADVFTFVVPTMSTPINGHWSAAQEQHVARSMVGRARRLNRAPIAHNPGHWTPAMGRSAVRRATAWLGLPYSWDGGTYSGPSYGACYGDGLITKFDCKFRGFDCSGLVLYGWGRYVHLDHFAATQRRQAGRFHPTVGELQPGDLLFFSGGGKQITHVVMYVGKGQVVEAAESGWPIRYTALADIMGWARYFGATRPVTARRLGTGPSVTALSQPTSAAAGGQTLTLHGARLDTTSRVAFGTTTIYDYTIKSAHTIVVKIPAHAPGKVHVRVWNAWGLSKASTANVFTYVDQ